MKTLKQFFKRKTFLMACTTIFVMACKNDDDAPQITQWELEVEQLKMATNKYVDFDVAQADGYDIDATGYRAQMGHHFLNTSILDGTFDIENPEVLLYAPDENGVMQFVAVEYGIPIEDINNPPPPPEGFTGDIDVWEVNTEFNLWTLHVWIQLENPYGMFIPRNPMLP